MLVTDHDSEIVRWLVGFLIDIQLRFSHSKLIPKTSSNRLNESYP